MEERGMGGENLEKGEGKGKGKGGKGIIHLLLPQAHTAVAAYVLAPCSAKRRSVALTLMLTKMET